LATGHVHLRRASLRAQGPAGCTQDSIEWNCLGTPAHADIDDRGVILADIDATFRRQRATGRPDAAIPVGPELGHAAFARMLRAAPLSTGGQRRPTHHVCAGLSEYCECARRLGADLRTP